MEESITSPYVSVQTNQAVIMEKEWSPSVLLVLQRTNRLGLGLCKPWRCIGVCALILFDSGSQLSYITEKLQIKLGLSLEKLNSLENIGSMLCGAW